MLGTETIEEKEARRFFEAVGLSAKRIPSASTTTADYFIDGDTLGYAVEVKTRRDDEGAIEALRRGDIADSERQLARDSAIERVARSSRKQFVGVDPSHERLWILWFSLRATLGADASFPQCLGTLYGIRDAIIDDNGQATAIECFYARPGVFERWSEIDGAIISTESGFVGCINGLSPRTVQMMQSRVMQRLGKAVVVPSQLEEVGSVFIAERSADRKDTQALQTALATKYGKKILVVDFTHAWAAKLSQSSS
jgi:hypothetical protein